MRAAAEASARLAEQTYDRTKQLTARDFASVQKLDEATASLDVAHRSQQQAKLALEEAVAGFTAEELYSKASSEKDSLHQRMETLARELWPNYLGAEPVPASRGWWRLKYRLTQSSGAPS